MILFENSHIYFPYNDYTGEALEEKSFEFVRRTKSTFIFQDVDTGDIIKLPRNIEDIELMGVESCTYDGDYIISALYS